MMRRRCFGTCRVAAAVHASAAARAQTSDGTAASPPTPPPPAQDAAVDTDAPFSLKDAEGGDNAILADIARMATDSSGTPEVKHPRGMMMPPGGAGPRGFGHHQQNRGGMTSSNTGGGEDQQQMQPQFNALAPEFARESLYREALSTADPLGGMPTEDYYRDPAAAYAPRYAPRDFANGGSLDHAHPLAPTAYEAGVAAREAALHELERRAADTAATRAALRSATDRHAVDEFVSAQAKASAEALATGARRPADTTVGGAFRDATIPRPTGSVVPSWHDLAADETNDNGNNFVARTAVGGAAATQRMYQSDTGAVDAALTERFNAIHGLRDRDHYETDRESRRYSQFQGYSPRPQFQYDLPNVVSPPAMAEAQAALRANAVPADEELAGKILSQNSVDAAPALGEALTERVTRALEGNSVDVLEQNEQAFRSKYGFGRQTNLVTDSGPDQRNLQLHRNDERLLNAQMFERFEYFTTPGGPNERQADRADGDFAAADYLDGGDVTRLIRSKFDIDRRQALLAAGKQDPLERSNIYYGMSPKLAVDSSVRFSRGRKFERHLEYYKPKPTLEDMQLYAVHEDVVGFPLLRNRQLAPYEFELFARYRAHHQQRRDLALRHGLEPRPNETIPERDARRRALDELCEKTPFDQSKMTPAKGTTSSPSAGVLRQWFGSYWLPSPTLVERTVATTQSLGLTLAEDTGSEKTAGRDVREHLLSMRYVNRLLTYEALSNKLIRAHIKESIQRAPEVELRFRHHHGITKHFTPDQRRQYDEFVAMETEGHLQRWRKVLQGRRFVAARGEFAAPRSFMERSVVEARRVSDGQRLWISPDQYTKLVRSADAATGAMMLDSEEVVIEGDGAAKSVAFVEFAFESTGAAGDAELMPETEWNTLPEETPATNPGDDPNAHINQSMKAHFNVTNYIEAQDVRWEERTALGDEGWTPALVPDGIRAGLPVLAPRPMASGAAGEPERAEVVSMEGRPFFNPKPCTVAVRFVRDGAAAEVPLHRVLVWQRLKDGPNRTNEIETREHMGNSNRFINFADPKGRGSTGKSSDHFLDKYRTRSAAMAAADEWSRTRNVRDVDEFNLNDRVRAENHRVFNSKHRRDYMTEFLHRYTPWEFIMTQEADQPVIVDQIRADDVGPTFFHGANRHWRAGKRRPFGFIKNSAPEVRDFFQYVDGVTPWEKAKKLRGHWDTREHHPMPYFNRPNLARHRNTQGLLPLSLFDVDRRTGSVKGLKDTLRDYRPARAAPAWTEL